MRTHLHVCCQLAACDRPSASVQYKSLREQLPTLLPRILPRYLLDYDLQTQLQRCPAAQQPFAAALQTLAAKKSAQKCSVCGRRGLPQTNADPDNDSDSEAALAEPDAARTSNKRTRSDASNGDAAAAATEQLHFTTVWQLNYDERLCELQAPAFCCGMCRACFDVGSMVQLAATRAGGSGGEDACASQTLIHRRSFGRCVCAFGIPARCAGGLRSSMQVQGQAWEHFYCPTLPLQFTSM